MSVALLYAMRVTTCTSAAFAIITVLVSRCGPALGPF